MTEEKSCGSCRWWQCNDRKFDVIAECEIDMETKPWHESCCRYEKKEVKPT